MTSAAANENKPFNKYEQRGAYHWSWYSTNKHNYQDNVNFVIEQLPPTGSVLDIGGGDGLVSFKMFEKGLDVTCIDSNERGIQLARQHFEKAIYGDLAYQRYPRKTLSKLRILNSSLGKRFEMGKAQFMVQSIFDMPLGVYDYAICHEVIEHVTHPNELLRIIHNSIRQFAIISTPDVTGRELHPLDYFGWTPETFSQLLQGFRFG